jgi:hypothetical protein
MTIEQVESAILELPLEQRRRLFFWFEQHSETLFTKEEELTDEQKNQILRRRQDYTEHPERFRLMDEKSLEAMFTRIHRHVAGVS